MRARRVVMRVIETCGECRHYYGGGCVHEGRRKSCRRGVKMYNGSPSGVLRDERPPTWCPLPRESDMPF